jgi:NADH:ubiquinone oxidoreductase subunit F (NADH-binding)
MLSLLLILLVFKPIYNLIELMSQYAQNVAFDRLCVQRAVDLKAQATLFKNIIASLNGCATSDAKQKCIDDHAEFIEEFCKNVTCSNRPRCLCGSVAMVLMFQQRLFPTKSVPNQWLQDFADTAYQALMLCAHAAYLFGEIQSDDMIDDFTQSMYAFTKLFSKIKQERLKSRTEKAVN